MAISIDYKTRTIYIPKVDLTLVQPAPIEIYELDIDTFRLKLKDLEDNADGMPFPDTHFNSTAVTTDGTTVTRVFEIINGYKVTFEDGNYTVNLINAHNNIGSVTNLNDVQVRSSNSVNSSQSSVSE